MLLATQLQYQLWLHLSKVAGTFIAGATYTWHSEAEFTIKVAHGMYMKSTSDAGIHIITCDQLSAVFTSWMLESKGARGSERNAGGVNGLKGNRRTKKTRSQHRGVQQKQSD